LGDIEACACYGAATATIDGEFEVKQELEVGTRYNVWDEARRIESVFYLGNILSNGIHEAGNSQSKRDGEHRLHGYQGVDEGGKSLEVKTPCSPYIVYTWMSVIKISHQAGWWFAGYRRLAMLNKL